MAELPTIVVAGYGAWASAEVNPASLVLDGLKRRDWPHCRLVPIEIPVVSAELFERIEATLLDLKPAVWIGLGVITGAAAISAVIKTEMVAINWRHFEVPDNAGVRAVLEPVVDDGPPAYSADIPNAGIVAALKANGIPATHSFFAGTHLCNQMLYTTRHLVDIHGLGTRCGFLHVPRSTEFVAKQVWPEDLSPSMSLEMMTDAVAIAVDHVTGRSNLELSMMSPNETWRQS